MEQFAYLARYGKDGRVPFVKVNRVSKSITPTYTKVNTFNLIPEMGCTSLVRKPGKRLIFRAWRRTSDGKILYAKDYGLKAWALWV